MKKLLLLFCATMLFISCGNHWWEDFTPRIWSIKNDTEQTLILKCPYSEAKIPSSEPISPKDLEYREFEIAPGKTVKICTGMIPKGSTSWFDYYFTQSVVAFGEDVSWQIMSEDGTVLKAWKYSDRGQSVSRFFDEVEWRDAPYGSFWRYFIFDIMPDDIQQ